MTAFLIALMVFLTVGFSQKAELSGRQKEARRRTRTNVALENELREIYTRQVQEELDQLQEANPNIDAWDALEHLYIIHEIPTKSTIEMLHPEWYGGKNSSMYYKDFAFNIEREKFKETVKEVKQMKGVKRKKDGAQKWLELSFSEQLKEENFVSLHLYVARRFTALPALITRMTERTLYKYGYHLSPDGVHESDWQEEIKNAPELEANRKKYPWMFGQ